MERALLRALGTRSLGTCSSRDGQGVAGSDASALHPVLPMKLQGAPHCDGAMAVCVPALAAPGGVTQLHMMKGC